MKVVIPSPRARNHPDDTIIRQMHVYESMVGMGINEVRLDFKDFQDLSSLNPEELKNWFETIHTRLLRG